MSRFTWKKFSTRMGEQLEDEIKPLAPLFDKLKSPRSEDDKRQLEQKLAIKVAPIMTTVFFEGLKDLSNDEFDDLVEEMSEAVKHAIEKIGKDYLDYQFVKEDPLRVLGELALVDGVTKATSKALEKRMDIFEDVTFLNRLIWLISLREFGLDAYLASLQKLFDVLNVARKTLDVSEDWVTALVALNMEEAILKKKLLEFGVEENWLKGKKYHELMERVVALIEEEENRRVSLEVLLSQGYRNARNKIDHEGFNWRPTEKESSVITAHLLRLTKELWSEKSEYN